MAGKLALWGLCLMIIFCCAISASSVEGYFPFKPKRVRCMDRNYPKCYFLPFLCPIPCPLTCVVDCVTCKPVCSCDRPGAVCQDPRFVGGDGITFYFHGKKDRDFCLVSDNNLHINAHFIGKTKPSIKRDLTWVQSIGILFDNHRLFIGAMKTSAWDDDVNRLSLVFDDKPISLPPREGAEWRATTVPSLVASRTRIANGVTIQLAGSFKITATVVPITATESRIHGYDITSDDCFAHLDLEFKFYSLSDDVSGVLGQTYAKNYTSRAKMGIAMPVLGGDIEFSSSGLFAADCAAARFGGVNAPSSNQFAAMNCVSGMDGPGVVCKR